MIGVDEVGRGCLAGPLLVVAARSAADLPGGLKDSKILSRSQRESLLESLAQSCGFGEGWVSASEIDKFGLASALRLGGKRALRALGAQADETIILDGSVNYLPKRFVRGRCQIKADASVPIVSAAGIYAKVTRDQYMIRLSHKHPGYEFESHVGYGTVQHKLALERLGPLRSVHRFSFAPLNTMSRP